MQNEHWTEKTKNDCILGFICMADNVPYSYLLPMIQNKLVKMFIHSLLTNVKIKSASASCLNSNISNTA